MESTGVYWRPVYALLEDDFEVILVNARHIKHVPGRKTDVRDCDWIGQELYPPAVIEEQKSTVRRSRGWADDPSLSIFVSATTARD